MTSKNSERTSKLSQATCSEEKKSSDDTSESVTPISTPTKDSSKKLQDQEKSKSRQSRKAKYLNRLMPDYPDRSI